MNPIDLPSTLSKGITVTLAEILLDPISRSASIVMSVCFDSRTASIFSSNQELDSENISAHYNLGQIYDRLGEPEKSAEHQKLHQRYKPDDTAQSRAVRLARQKYPAGNHAAKPLVIYPLQRVGAPGLPVENQTTDPNSESGKP